MVPLKPGMQFVFEGYTDEGGQAVHHRLVFTVTDLTKVIEGVRAVVAWIVDYSNDQLVEKEISFYAQDNDGTVWYLGEHPEAYEDGKLVDAPTWIHGLAGARAGITMKAKPQLGLPSYSSGGDPRSTLRIARGLTKWAKRSVFLLGTMKTSWSSPRAARKSRTLSSSSTMRAAWAKFESAGEGRMRRTRR